MDQFLKIAALSDEEVRKLRDLERITGKHIMAFEPGLRIASLTDEDIQSVRDLEAEFGATLLVFEPQ